MEKEFTEDLDSWKGIVKNYLKAENLKEKEGSFVVEEITAVLGTTDDGEKRIKLEIETTIDDVVYIYSPNWTATKVLKEAVERPKDLLGKTLFYQKIKVQNPTTKKTVDSISIVKVE